MVNPHRHDGNWHNKYCVWVKTRGAVRCDCGFIAETPPPHHAPKDHMALFPIFYKPYQNQNTEVENGKVDS